MFVKTFLTFKVFSIFQIEEIERLQQVNLNMYGSELNAIQALSCNFFTPIVVEGSTSYSQPK